MQPLWPKSTEPAELIGDEVHVWSASLNVESERLADEWTILSLDERERAGRFRVADAQRRFVVTRITLRKLLGRYTDMPPAAIAFDYEANGKPRLAGDGLQFNVAHSDELALIAIARGTPVGVDVERIRIVERCREIAERYFHPAEIAQLVEADAAVRSTAFLRCWTNKEALLKAVGIGVTHSLDFFVGESTQSDGALVAVQAGAGQAARCWLQSLVPAADYVGAIACVGTPRRLCCFTFA